MPAPIQKVSFLLNGSINERSIDELAGPVAAQGTPIILRRSENTRLSVSPGTCSRSPEVASSLTFDGPCHGIVPAAAGRNSALLFRRGVSPSQVVSELGTGTGNGNIRPSKLGVTGNRAANCYLPAQINRAGVIPGPAADSSVSSVYHASSNLIWIAYTARDQTGSLGYTIYATALDVNSGAVVGSPAAVASALTNPRNWVGITTHGSYGVRVWMCDNSRLRVASVSLSGNEVVTGGTTTVYTAAGIDSTFDVCSDGGQFAFITGVSHFSVNSGRITRYDVLNATVDGFRSVGDLTGNGHTAISYHVINGTPYILVAFSSDATTNVISAGTYGTTATLSSASTLWTAADAGEVAIQRLKDPVTGVDAAVVAVTRRIGSLGLGSNVATRFYAAAAVGGVSMSQFYTLPWTALHDRGATLTVGTAEAYPVFSMVRNYGTSDSSPLSSDYVTDPAIETWMIGSTDDVSPVARHGTVRYTAGAARIRRDTDLPSGGMSLVSTYRAFTTYRKDVVGSSGQTDYPGRYVELDFTPRQLRVVDEKDGAAFVAAALPVQWDGVELVELGAPLSTPRFYFNGSTGAGPVYPAGTYQFTVVFKWDDHSGLSHRSAPAPIRTWNAAGGTSPVIMVARPPSLRDGVKLSTVEAYVYASEVGGDTLHLLPDHGDVSDYWFTFSYLSTPDVSREQLYSSGALEGEELVPQPPCPAWDMAIVGDRCWIIDAEIRTRAVPSKKRIAGRGFEFEPSLEVTFPSGAGKLMAVREWQGTPIFLTEFGVYQLGGDGPDNLLGNPSGGGFGRPVKVADLGCTDRASVVTTPRGIMWQRYDRAVLFSGGPPVVIPNVVLDQSVCGVLQLQSQDEVVYFVGQSAKVWNTALDRWTTWNSQTLQAEVVQCAQLPWDRDFAFLLGQDYGLYAMDSTSRSGAPMSWETDWLVLGGDFLDHIVLHRVAFSAQWESAHGIGIEIMTNYDETATTTRVWSAAELTALATKTENRYTIVATPKNNSTRAVKLRFTETDAAPEMEGLKPICVTVYFSVQGQMHEAGLPQGSVK